MRKIATALALLAVVTAVLAACGPSQTLGPKETAEAFLKAMGERNFTAAYDLLSVDTQATVAADEFSKIVGDAWASAGITGFQIKSVQEVVYTTRGTRASVPYSATLQTTSGTTTDIYNALSLVQENGQWRVIWPPAR